MPRRTGSGRSDRAPAAGEPLAQYRRMRDFSRTAEPAGERAARRRRGRLAFVIQKHAASHLHYDLRLELDGVMKSWAVPKGPSLDPAVKRLAMQVEDHPVEYNTFEGTIPKGEYGGGTVMLWDRGTYSPDEPRQGEDDAAAVRRGLRAGKLSFTFHGERLHGSYALVRTDRGPKPKWLLIKHRDEEATSSRDVTAEVRTSVATGRTMEEIAGEADRVWRSNRTGSTGAEEPGAGAAAPAGVAPMKPRPARALPEAGSWTYEPWRGGARVLAYAAPDAARLFDDRGRDVTARHRAVAAELETLAGRIGHGFVAEAELVVQPAPALHLTDLLIDGTETLLDRAWRERRRALGELLKRRRLKLVHRPEHEADGAALLRRAVRQHWPGIIARRDDGTYTPGTTSDAMLRIGQPLRRAG